MTHSLRTTVLACALGLQGCTVVQTHPDPPGTSSVASLIPAQQARVASFFGAPFPRDFETVVLPDRTAFADFTESRWGFRAEPCWMVAAGTGSVFAIIAPEAWATEACEHDAADAEHVRRLVAHELVHVYHGQHNADPEFDTMAPLGWFVEGLAVYASGQFDAERRAQAARTARDGWSEHLERAWSGEARYAVCGAIAAWIDETRGRETLVTLLGARSTHEALDMLGSDEDTLLRAVQDWLGVGQGD